MGHQEDVGIVLVEASHPEEARERSGRLIPVHVADLAHAKGQLPIAMRIRLVKEHASRAVHRLDGKIPLFDLQGEHILFIVEPVARLFPEVPGHDAWGFDLHIAAFKVSLSRINCEQFVPNDHPFGQDKGHPGSFFFQGKESNLGPKIFMIPFFGLFKQVQVLFQSFLSGNVIA